MSTNKFRRAYSLRIPRSPKPASFMESSGFYDRLDETDCQDDLQAQNEISGNKDNNFSWEIPLITEAPKLHYCRKKWSSKSLRLPKTRMTDAVPPACQPKDVSQVNNDTQDLYQDMDKTSSAGGRRLSNGSESHRDVENDEDKQKCKKMKHYKKTIDRAFRRGWETFITNIYTISLTRTSQDAPQLVKAC